MNTTPRFASSYGLAAFLLLAGMAIPTPVAAQLNVTLRVPHSRVLQYEPVTLRVVLENNSGRPIEFFGNENDARMELAVELAPGRPVLPTKPMDFGPAVTIPPGESKEILVDLLDFFEMEETGPHTVFARVHWAGKVFVSSHLYLDMVPGMEIERMVTSTTHGPPALNTFSLRTLHRKRGDFLFLRIENEDLGLCYGVYELGRLLRTYPPALRIDSAGYVHVLHQSGPNSYTHSVFTAEGDPLKLDVHAGGSSARLEETSSGRLEVRVSEAEGPGFGRRPGMAEGIRNGSRRSP